MLTLFLLLISVAFADDLVWTPITPETQPGFLDEDFMDPERARLMMVNAAARTLYNADKNQLPESISFRDQRYRKKHQERLRVERDDAQVLFWDDKEKKLLPLEQRLAALEEIYEATCGKLFWGRNPNRLPTQVKGLYYNQL